MSKMKKTLNDECVAFDIFSSSPQRCCYHPEDSELYSIYNKIHDVNWKKHWTDSSGKSDVPPDFYSEEYGLMMEFMIVDDHSHVDSKGLINPQKRSDSKAYNDLTNYLDSSLMNQLEAILITTSTELPSDEDHNYVFYVEEVKRVISKHIEKIQLYRENHPRCKLIFFIQDESTLYVEVEKEHHEAFKRKDAVEACPHFPYVDKEMVNSLIEADIDYVVWWMPYRLPEEEWIPTVAIFRPRDLNNLRYYPPELMLSTED